MKKFKGLILITLLLGFFIGINSIVHAAPILIDHYEWSIYKHADQDITELYLNTNEPSQIDYVLVVSATPIPLPDGLGLLADGGADRYADIYDDMLDNPVFLGLDATTVMNPTEFLYSVPVEPYDTPGTYPFMNTATLIPWDSGDPGAISADWSVDIIVVPPATEPVPEPTTMFLLGTGLVGVAGAARRKKKNQA